jgi:hypothetical protein
MSDNNIQTHFLEYSLTKVMQYFIDGFEPKEGERIMSTEWFVDTAKGRVIFRVMTEAPPPKVNDER